MNAKEKETKMETEIARLKDIVVLEEICNTLSLDFKLLKNFRGLPALLKQPITVTLYDDHVMLS